MLTFNHLLSDTPSDVRARSKKVHAVISKAEVIKRGGKKGVKFSASGRAATEKIYYACEVELYPATINEKNGIQTIEAIDANTECYVHCQCPYHTFHFEWVLWKNGSGPLRQSTNKPPHITNPQMIAGVCKHLYRIMPLALKALKQISIPK